jgi:hypothetical protein
MSTLHRHDDYQTALYHFQSFDCRWKYFENVQMKVANNRCPICECLIDGSVTRLNKKNNNTAIVATVDHYRPLKHYDFLACNHENYLLMCSDCNNIYKGCEFPLYDSAERAMGESELQDEKPLIVNPIYDDLLELFVLVFKRSSRGKNILELRPKASTGYLHEKALATIKLFGLGDCDTNRHRNNNVYNCRINILESHFGVFYEFAKALKAGEKQKAGLELQAHRNIFKRYGFFVFLQKKDNFEVNTPS